MVADALAKGATLRTGGERIGNTGYFYRPTVLTDVPETARMLQDEPFGPIAVLSPFTDREEAMVRANSTPFGLAAYAFTRSQEDAAFVARRFESGMVGINTFAVGGAERPSAASRKAAMAAKAGWRASTPTSPPRWWPRSRLDVGKPRRDRSPTPVYEWPQSRGRA
uniref:Aldehyde dehydrogenase family protein n=1 Tax=Phenylobacterium glaciei TaxID=2803784 RepID=A0A974S9R1_9CAUL|nr:aldehyde dehydrogenase family protein [Phenylobacterium glaciei]